MPTRPRLRLPLANRALGAMLVVLVLTVTACSSGGADDGEGTGASSTTTAEETATSGDEPTTTTTTTTTVAEPPELPEGREVDVMVPAGHDADRPAPLVVLLHGFGVDGPVQDAYFGLGEAAGARGMLAVAPSGTENADGRRFWNATEACCAFGASDVDDVGYILDLIATVEADYAVDPKQVFLVGHSNGGFMSFRMACEHAEVIAAVVSLAGATFADPADCTPSEPVATLQIHGTADETIGYDGGDNGGRAYPGALETLETWAGYNGCDLTPDDPAPEPRTIIQGSEPATVTSHSDCDPGGHSELWTAPGGAHIPALTPDFSAQVLEFLLAHPKP